MRNIGLQDGRIKEKVKGGVVYTSAARRSKSSTKSINKIFEGIGAHLLFE
jgi:hypothetical protein